LKAIDIWLQRWRIGRAGRHVPHGSSVLDVGSYDGALFRQLADRIGEGVGIDEEIDRSSQQEGFRLVKGRFPDDLTTEQFDVITMLAVLEHVPPAEQPPFAQACARHLRPGGLLVITTPAPAVDWILDALRFLRLIDGMSLEQHYGFKPADTPGIFEPAGFRLVEHETFQLGLNHLFVFEKLATQ
jgi:2-polyprenyl-3-methyl-5-hydroxy-6-metoxy-1,4-benzoquinol methylase